MGGKTVSPVAGCLHALGEDREPVYGAMGGLGICGSESPKGVQNAGPCTGDWTLGPPSYEILPAVR